MIRHGLPRRSVALLLLLLLPACYSYRPLETDSPRAGDDVRIHLTEEGARAAAATRASETGSGAYVTGLVLRSEGDAVTLSTRGERYLRSGVGSAAYRDTLTLSGPEIRQIERNELDAARTAVLAGLGAGAVAAAVILVINADPSGSSGVSGGGGPRASVEIPIRIPLGLP